MALASFKGGRLSAGNDEINLPHRNEILASDNTIYCDMITGERRIGKISFNEEFISICAKTVAEYLKNNPNILENL